MLGVIADDFTGASDIASFLVENGLSTIQFNGIPSALVGKNTEAIVISLKSRSNPAEQAVQQSLDALAYLKEAGCTQFYFKYCSTFDSTEKGNIGPVTDALLEALDENFTIISPALPVNGRTIFHGYLFVGDVLLNESGMQNHPITPMRDANLIRLMDAQAQGKTGLVPYTIVCQGVDAIKVRLAQLAQDNYRYAVVDSLDNQHLASLAEAITDFKLVTGGSGLAGLMASHISQGKKAHDAFEPPKLPSVILSGSCSVMSNKQVDYYKKCAPTLALDITRCHNDAHYLSELCEWVLGNQGQALAPMVYATTAPSQLKAIQEKYGAQEASQRIEQTFAQLAQRLYQQGIQTFISAGGETSSIIVQHLGIEGFNIGKQIAPGVPWLKALEKPLYLALKSGNFGQETFFVDAQEMSA
ncbi:3-oxo-tetronate kinase [Spirabiliibacterium falconis]|uniref:3-oxo-tetronate kinase n=1 Tax=Spirabiliibacterium falconis TaxID=572023 RepID=UPI001AAC4AA2|nr:3-oxo-tetronate kinase [Spirabiliibacterium falconis]MBE2894565.1 four-carbon acid sugar kinase family protein [Spirabiliibacterium falconis]